MFKIVTCFILMFVCFEYSEAQNLISDSSFEKNTFIPTNFSEIRASKSWGRPSWGTSDLFCKCATKKKIFSLVNVPENLMGSQYPHSGTCYAGLFAFSHGDYREYLQTHLITPLEKGKYYRLTMYVSLADYSRATVDQLGVCFLTHEAGYDNSNVITNLNPVYVTIENEVGKDTVKWHQVSMIYKSFGGESYLLIGSFEIHKVQKTKVKAPKNVNSRINQRTDRDAYYYIDDVSLIELKNYYPIDSTVNVAKTLLDTLLNTRTLILKNILFETNQATLLPVSYTDLDIMVDYLNKNLKFRIEVVGHTDNIGSESQNKILSEKRAKAVSDYFFRKNINEDRVSYKGYGSEKPITSNETAEGRQINRRVEFVITENK